MNRPIYYFIQSIWILALMSCHNHNSDKNDSLIKEEESILYHLDNQTKTDIMTMMTYQDKDGSEYLTFQNPDNNDILFYDLNTHDFKFKITPDIDGANGIGFLLGYYIHNLDSIFLTTRDLKEIPLINRNAEVLDKINYEETSDGITLQQTFSSTALYQPITIINNDLYILTGYSRWQKERPVSACIDLKSKEIHALPFEYPKFPNTSNEKKRCGIEEYVSRCFNGKEFVYSFYYDENIYVASIDHKDIKKIKVKSQYINQVEYVDDYGRMTMEQICGLSNYGNLIYDKYRNVYYRVAYPKTEIEKGIKGIELHQYGRKNFSIIVLNKDFEIIGETLFPDYTYNSNLMYIREDGLYISNSHYLNPEYSDDVLSFKRFVLSKE